MQPETTAPSAAHAAIINGGRETIGDREYIVDPRGALMPKATVRPMDLLQDEAVRKIIAHAVDLEAQIQRFKGHVYDDIGSLQALVAQEYKTKLGGAKGNLSLTSIDGTLKVTLQVADHLEFGPELQAAKALVDECLIEWSAASSDELRAVINRAFAVDKEGKIDRAAIYLLLRVQIEDARWQRAMDAIRDSIRVVGSKTYVRFHRRDTADGAWRPIVIDLAAA